MNDVEVGRRVSFGPHSATGDRTAMGSVEQRIVADFEDRWIKDGRT